MEILGLAIDVVLQFVVNELQVHQAIGWSVYFLLFEQIDCFGCVLKPLAGLVVETTVDYLHGDVPPILVIVLVVISVLGLGSEARVLSILGSLKSLEVL